MKNGIIDEVKKLRKQENLNIEPKEENRHCITLHESGGRRTAYYFSTPIRRFQTHQLIDMKFSSKKDGVHLAGSNADITLADDLYMHNGVFSYRIKLPEQFKCATEKEITFSCGKMWPTTNGVALQVDSSDKTPYRMRLNASEKCFGKRYNGKYFALMLDDLHPLLIVSCIGTIDETGAIIAPASVDFCTTDNLHFDLSVQPACCGEAQVRFEINLYEPKLFSDTTVESKNPTINNAFGGIAYLGKTDAFGEQWLYTRVDTSAISEMFEKRVAKVFMHIPKHNQTAMLFSAHCVLARFCSFTSTWETKMNENGNMLPVTADASYVHVDMTDLLTDPHTKQIRYSNGFILKAVKGNDFSVISTGDSCFAPQILEIQYE